MRRYPAVALPMVTLLVLAACGGAAAPSTASNTPTEQASPTTPPTPTPSPDPTVAPTGDDATGLAECFSGDMPNFDSGWKFIKGGDATFGLAYPEDWDDLSGLANFTAATLLDEQTFAELGLGTDAKIKADFVRSPQVIPNLSVFRFGTVRSSATEILEREIARYGELAEIERIVDPSVEGCLGGTRAPGLALEFRSSDGNTYYQQNLFAVRNGELYVVQWLDRLDPDLDLLAEILTTWGWIGGFAEPSGTAGIPEVGVAEAWAADAREHRGKVGQDFQYECPPSGIPGAIWGTEIYTDDSSVCTAAVHDGKIDLDTGGTVTIEIQPGWSSYKASDQNGISSTAYPAWDGSFVFLP